MLRQDDCVDYLLGIYTQFILPTYSLQIFLPYYLYSEGQILEAVEVAIVFHDLRRFLIEDIDEDGTDDLIFNTRDGVSVFELKGVEP